ncbi:MAG: sigma-54-dependent Fis family transcriptional regulator [Desulfobacteraceae bacterium]|nr:sigma-54-dependent Fis family transcriptional regulator [Desulfobacteraceae bacterium]MCB9494904.1 sigma-54-dependent Fis family transcriptional regulator [Desulfobacteraceae bacterium]
MDPADKRKKILIADDDEGIREFLEIILSRQNYVTFTADSGHSAINAINDLLFDLILCDIRLGDLSGIEVLKHARKKYPDITVIMMSAYATTENAVEAMNNGAYDYLPKPFDNDDLLNALSRALKMKSVEKDREDIEKSLKQNIHFNRIVGSSPKMADIYKKIGKAAPTKTNIMITGESGTGKELIARAVHEQSERRDFPFVVINCGGIPESLMESEFFGYVKGAFTGAERDKKGLFAAANKGTLFLDEIGELPITLQVKLLRAVQEKKIKPVGGNIEFNIDVRIICATNRNLEKEVIEGRFREDLFYRLNVIELRIPPLRERKEDIKTLAQHFMDKYSKETGKKISKLSSYALDLLQKYDFPGNVRELENIIERSVALSSTNIILPESLSLSFYKRELSKSEDSFYGEKRLLSSDFCFDLNSVEAGVNLDEILAETEKSYLLKALEITKGNKKKASKLLNISFRSFRYRLSKLDIE